MPKSNFMPTADHELLVWLDHFVANLGPEHGVSESNLAALKAATEDFHHKTNFASNASAISKQATADKNDSHQVIEKLVRAEARRIKSGLNYTEGMGAHLGIEGSESTHDLSTSMPNLSGIDRTGGVVALSFTKNKSDGVNIYCQRENDNEWVLLNQTICMLLSPPQRCLSTH